MQIAKWIAVVAALFLVAGAATVTINGDALARPPHCKGVLPC